MLSWKAVVGEAGDVNGSAPVIRVYGNHINKEQACKIRDLVMDPKHQHHKWIVTFDQCFPKDDEAVNLLAQAMSANIVDLSFSNSRIANIYFIDRRRLVEAAFQPSSFDKISTCLECVRLHYSTQIDNGSLALTKIWLSKMTCIQDLYVCATFDNSGGGIEFVNELLASVTSKTQRLEINVHQLWCAPCSNFEGHLLALPMDQWEGHLEELCITNKSRAGLFDVSNLQNLRTLSLTDRTQPIDYLPRLGIIPLIQSRKCQLERLFLRMCISSDFFHDLLSALTSYGLLKRLTLTNVFPRRSKDLSNFIAAPTRLQSVWICNTDLTITLYLIQGVVDELAKNVTRVEEITVDGRSKDFNSYLLRNQAMNMLIGNNCQPPLVGIGAHVLRRIGKLSGYPFHTHNSMYQLLRCSELIFGI